MLEHFEGFEHRGETENLLGHEHGPIAKMLRQRIGEVESGESVDEPVIPVREVTTPEENRFVDAHSLTVEAVHECLIALRPEHTVTCHDDLVGAGETTRTQHELPGAQ